jgi:hypothetical protein
VGTESEDLNATLPGFEGRRVRPELEVDAQPTEQVQLADAVAKRPPARVFRVGLPTRPQLAQRISFSV